MVILYSSGLELIYFNKIPSIEFRLNEFEGPLDLLLYLIHKAEVNIYDIPIADITEQYLAYLKDVKSDMKNYSDKASEVFDQELLERKLEDLTRFHVMSATLLQIKSRMLLPKSYSSDNEYVDPRREIVTQLIEYQKFKRLSQELMSLNSVNKLVFVQREDRQLFFFDMHESFYNKDLFAHDLRVHFEKILTEISGGQIADFYEEFTVNEKLVLLSEKMSLYEVIPFADLIFSTSAVEIICSFWAVLEFAKIQALTIIQEKPFSAIKLKRSKLAEEKL